MHTDRLFVVDEGGQVAVYDAQLRQLNLQFFSGKRLTCVAEASRFGVVAAVDAASAYLSRSSMQLPVTATHPYLSNVRAIELMIAAGGPALLFADGSGSVVLLPFAEDAPDATPLRVWGRFATKLADGQAEAALDEVLESQRERFKPALLDAPVDSVKAAIARYGPLRPVQVGERTAVFEADIEWRARPARIMFTRDSARAWKIRSF
jgi:hypothetical protein